MVFLRTFLQETVPGQDVFIVGGRTDGNPIDIRINALPEQFSKYNAWSTGDTQLDWNGAEPQQVLLRFLTSACFFP